MIDGVHDIQTSVKVQEQVLTTVYKKIQETGVMPGVTFLSGGISDEDASIYLNEINKVPRKTQTRLTFSYSRALQSSCIKTWKGEAGNVDAAQKQLLARAQANGEAGNVDAAQKQLL